MEFFQANIKLGEVLVQLIAFLIVFLTLKKLAWKPVLSALESRRRLIQDRFEEIDSAKREIEKLKTEYQTHLQRIEEEARAKLQEAIEDGRRIARDIQDKARTEAQKTLTETKDNIGIEIAKARLELKREIADLSIRVSEKILKDKISLDKNQDAKILQLIEDLERQL